MNPNLGENVDSSEINKFSNVAHSWWDPQGPVHTLHKINPLRLQFVLDLINLTDKNLLDVGCGGGIFSEALAQQEAHVSGIDASKELIQVAKLHLLESKLKIDYHATMVEKFSEKNSDKFDVITCMELLEHVPDPKKILQSISEMTKKEGYIFVSTINRNLKSFLSAIVAAEYFLRIIPKGTHSYEKFITPAELNSIAITCGLKLVKMAGLAYYPIQKQFSLTQDISVNYLACFQKI